MAPTQVRGPQILNGSIQRDDLDAATSGQAVVKKVVAGTGINLGSTGVDAGTGDVTVNLTTPVAVASGGTGATNSQTVTTRQAQVNALIAALAGDCVLSGCAVTAQGSPDRTVAVAKGAIMSNGVLKPVTAGNVTTAAADGTNPRFDVIVADSTGAKACRAGTAAADPALPTLTANDVVLALVYTAANDTTVSTADITDLRMLATKRGPILIDKVTSPVTFNTTSTIQTYYSLVLPNGLFLSGKRLRVRCGGNYLSNNGTPTWTLTISYGGTAMYTSTTAASTADADRGAWFVEFILVAQANNDQSITGVVGFTNLGAKTAPAVGIGSMAATDRVAPIAGAAAVDSDAADRTLTVQWTMSISNAAHETVMEDAAAELM